MAPLRRKRNGAYMPEIHREALSEAIGLAADRIGVTQPPLGLGWFEELEAARPSLRMLNRAIANVLAAGERPLTAMNRCAAALATLPAVARARPDAAMVWFDAHGDCNTPEQSVSGYLGGMVLTGAAGHWETGLGDTLDLGQVVLVGARDLDVCERELIGVKSIELVGPGPYLVERLRAALAGRPAYVHLDCDVLAPGLVPTEYQVPGGLSLADLNVACAVIAEQEVIGLEIAEFEATWPHGALGDTNCIVDAVEPLISAMTRCGIQK